MKKQVFFFFPCATQYPFTVRSEFCNIPLSFLSGGIIPLAVTEKKKMERKYLIVLVLAALACAVLLGGCTTQKAAVTTPAPVAAATTAAVTGDPKLYSQAELDAQQQWRQLWTDHAVWTRLYIIEALGDDPAAADAAAARLLKNQEDIGNAIRPYYGDAAGDQLTALLKEHIAIAVAIVNDVKTGNTPAQAADETRWTTNANQIAAFLAAANPNLPEADVRELMYMHLGTTRTELATRARGDYPADVQAWDGVYDHILRMSDALSGGIIKQFPEKFAGPKLYSQKEADLSNGLRHLWTDHTVWTRLYIVESLDGDSPGADSAAVRLLKNQEDIGNAIRPVYGDAAATQLTALLKDHIMIATDIVSDVKAGNATAQAADETRWTANADQIAGFLAGANSNWPAATLQDMMHMHLATTKAELMARATKNYPEDVKAYDAVYAHILKMSDALTAGIVRQFPGMF